MKIVTHDGEQWLATSTGGSTFVEGHALGVRFRSQKTGKEVLGRLRGIPPENFDKATENQLRDSLIGALAGEDDSSPTHYPPPETTNWLSHPRSAASGGSKSGAKLPPSATGVVSQCGSSPRFNRRAAVARETLQAVAAARTVISWPAGSGAFRGRPMRRPAARARAIPACTRSAILSRSNCAIAPSRWSCRRPAGVVVSMASFKLTNATPSAVSSSMVTIRCRRLRPNRSRRQQTTPSNRRRFPSRRSSSKAGRRSRAPLMPWSQYSRTIVQPRASA